MIRVHPWFIRVPRNLVNRHARVERFVALFDPRVLRVIDSRQALGAAGQDVEVVGGVADRAGDRVIALGDQHHVVVTGDDGRVDGVAGLVQRRIGAGIDSLQGIALRPVELVVVDLIQVGLDQAAVGGDPVDIVLVRRVARPVAAGGVDLHHDQPLARKAGWEHLVDLAGGVIAPANFDADLGRGDQPRREFLIGRDPGDREFAVGGCRHRQVGVNRQVERIGQAGEDVGPPAEALPLPAVRSDIDRASQDHQRELVLPGCEGPTATLR